MLTHFLLFFQLFSSLKFRANFYFSCRIHYIKSHQTICFFRRIFIRILTLFDKLTKPWLCMNSFRWDYSLPASRWRHLWVGFYISTALSLRTEVYRLLPAPPSSISVQIWDSQRFLFPTHKDYFSGLFALPMRDHPLWICPLLAGVIRFTNNYMLLCGLFLLCTIPCSTGAASHYDTLRTSSKLTASFTIPKDGSRSLGTFCYTFGSIIIC